MKKISGNKTLIIGSEQSGKSTLAKTLFRQYHSNGSIPVLIKGDSFKKLPKLKM